MYRKLLPIPGVTPESPLSTPQGVRGQLEDGHPERAYSFAFGFVNLRRTVKNQTSIWVRNPLIAQ